MTLAQTKPQVVIPDKIEEFKPDSDNLVPIQSVGTAWGEDGVECVWIITVKGWPIWFEGTCKRLVFGLVRLVSENRWHWCVVEGRTGFHVSIRQTLVEALRHAWDDTCLLIHHATPEQVRDAVGHARAKTCVFEQRTGVRFPLNGFHDHISYEHFRPYEEETPCHE